MGILGSCEGVEFLLLNGNGDMSERSTTTQISSSESDNTNILSSLGSNLTVATVGILTVDVPDSLVNMTVGACICDSKRPMILNELGPKIHIDPSSVLVF